MQLYDPSRMCIPEGMDFLQTNEDNERRDKEDRTENNGDESSSEDEKEDQYLI